MKTSNNNNFNAYNLKLVYVQTVLKLKTNYH